MLSRYFEGNARYFEGNAQPEHYSNVKEFFYRQIYLETVDTVANFVEERFNQRITPWVIHYILIGRVLSEFQAWWRRGWYIAYWLAETSQSFRHGEGVGDTLHIDWQSPLRVSGKVKAWVIHYMYANCEQVLLKRTLRELVLQNVDQLLWVLHRVWLWYPSNSAIFIGRVLSEFQAWWRRGWYITYWLAESSQSFRQGEGVGDTLHIDWQSPLRVSGKVKAWVIHCILIGRDLSEFQARWRRGWYIAYWLAESSQSFRQGEGVGDTLHIDWQSPLRVSGKVKAWVIHWIGRVSFRQGEGVGDTLHIDWQRPLRVSGMVKAWVIHCILIGRVLSEFQARWRRGWYITYWLAESSQSFRQGEGVGDTLHIDWQSPLRVSGKVKAWVIHCILIGRVLSEFQARWRHGWYIAYWLAESSQSFIAYIGWQSPLRVSGKVKAWVIHCILIGRVLSEFQARWRRGWYIAYWLAESSQSFRQGEGVGDILHIDWQSPLRVSGKVKAWVIHCIAYWLAESSQSFRQGEGVGDKLHIDFLKKKKRSGPSYQRSLVKIILVMPATKPALNVPSVHWEDEVLSPYNHVKQLPLEIILWFEQFIRSWWRN